jgi:hypothetical protein
LVLWEGDLPFEGMFLMPGSTQAAIDEEDTDFAPLFLPYRALRHSLRHLQPPYLGGDFQQHFSS